MRMFVSREVLFFLAVTAGRLHAGPIQIASSAAYVHGNGALIVQLDSSASSYFSTLDSNNVGTFGWTFTNTTASTLSNTLFLAFLDADIDRDLNTFFNEYGEFIGLSLPPGAPGGAIGAFSWEIDEPGFVFGDIVTNLEQGALDNTNDVPSSAPDDVSLALGFSIGSLAPGQRAHLTLQISPDNIAGLHQVDPDSNVGFYFNGFAMVDPLTTQTPEPGGWILVISGAAALFLRKRRQL